MKYKPSTRDIHALLSMYDSAIINNNKQQTTMSFASKYNKTVFAIDTTDYKYVSLSDLFNDKLNGGPEVVYPLNGIRISKSDLGESPLFIDEQHKLLVNIPQHMTATCKEILADDEAVNDIRQGKAGYRIYTYRSHNKDCYSIKFVDM